ncbi:MAG: sulfite exporter TauE/SafE family protein [Patescibacteria group bacterium]|nr:sulfite exporter TauE/SafE family protein [Patescibacteria group bacterium]
MLTDVLLLVVGIVVGTMNAIAGGGMLVGFPVLLAVGLPALVANATSNIIILPGQLASAYGYRKYLRQVPRVYLWLLPPCAVGAAFGALILRRTSSNNFEQLVPGLILFAVVLFAFQPLLHFHVHKQLKTKKVDNRPLLYIGLALLPLAVYGGYFGAGFGFVMLAFLGFTNLHDVHKMNALKNLAASTMAIVSIFCLFSARLIDWRHGLVMAAGTTIGGYCGSRLAQRIPSHTIRIVVITIGLITASYLFLRQY